MAFNAQNDLERSLIQAAKDPAHRPQFYRDFLNAELFVIEEGPPRQSTTGPRTLEQGTKLALLTFQRDNQTLIPIFSSLPRLQTFIKQEANYVAMKTPDFLKMTKGATLLLNPGSDYGKEFTAPEIASLLDGSFWRPTDTFVTQKATKVLVGQPANYPTDLVAALTRYFQTTPQVTKAYLALYHNPDRDPKPHTLIAIEVTGDWDQIASGAGIVSQNTNIPDPPIDFFQLTGKPGLDDHFKSLKPFYEKKQQPQ
jgi:hypothetical protein